MRGYTEEGVYTVLKDVALSVSPNAYVTGRYMPIPPSFPCVFMREINRPETRQGMQLDAQDEQWESNFEIQVSSNLKTGAKIEATKISKALDAKMKQLYYRKVSDTPIDDGEKYTLALRFRRVIGGGDTMPE